MQGQEPTTNTAHTLHWDRESNPGHIGGKRVLSPLRHPCTMCELISSPSSGITPAYSLPTLQVALLAQLDTGSHPVIGKVRVQIPVIAEFSSSAFLYAYAYYVTARNQFTIFMYF